MLTQVTTLYEILGLYDWQKLIYHKIASWVGQKIFIFKLKLLRKSTQEFLILTACNLSWQKLLMRYY